MVNERPSTIGHFAISIEVIGNNLEILNQESGGVRLQRVPPTERHGRVHTSTVTVSVIDPYQIQKFDLKDSDLTISWYSGSGNGGSNRNKCQTSCRLVHVPTNTIVTAQTRSRENSYKQARSDMKKRLLENHNFLQHSKISQIKKEQVGSGMRGDKVRTIQFQRDKITDHRNGRTMSATQFMNGGIDKLWS